MIELYYNTNTCRKRIAEIEPKEIDVSNPSGVLLKIYQESGYPNATMRKGCMPYQMEFTYVSARCRA